MNFQKSPFPYLILLACIVATAVYSNFTIDKEIERPIVHQIENAQISEQITNSNK